MYRLKKKSFLIISAMALLGLLLSGCSTDTANGKIQYDHVAMPKETDDRLFSDAESRRDEWNRLKPFFDQVMAEDAENIIIVSHGDLLSVFNSMFLGLEVESLNICEMFGFAGGVSQMIVRNDGKRVIKRISDMSFVR